MQGYSLAQSELPNKMEGKEEVQRKALTPEKLWALKRVSAESVAPDKSYFLYAESSYDIKENKLTKKIFSYHLKDKEKKVFLEKNGSIVKIQENGDVFYTLDGVIWKKNIHTQQEDQVSPAGENYSNVKFSPDNSKILFSRKVQVKKYHSPIKYPQWEKSNVYIYDDLDYRHWDYFNDGTFAHPFVADFTDGEITHEVDLLEGEPYYSPQAPFGGGSDMVWAPDGKSILYVTKKKFGKEYAQSTNTDIFQYDLATKETVNLTEDNKGYDTNPVFSPNGQRLAWLSMKTDGYEADKNDLIVYDPKSGLKVNVTSHWDGTVNSFLWSEDGTKIYFNAPFRGTIRLFVVDVPANLAVRSLPVIQELSGDQADISGLVAVVDGGVVVTSTKITQAQEIYFFDVEKRTLSNLSRSNEETYKGIYENKVESRITQASDGKDLFSWVIYPPDFDPNKKYPTLLYAQGGPQSALTQFYSLRWNFQLIASQGYIVVAPNRRGMPGWGEQWNKDISEDWGGQSIRDYLAAIDDIAKEDYVDEDRLGAIGASYGGYSVFMLAGVHENRFKTFIAHAGLFNMQSWYGTTEELFFANHDIGGPYWEKPDHPSYNAFNPINHIDKWNTPILIIQGGKDYRVPLGQSFEAFQAAQLKNIKSRLVFLPDENHWVLQGQNAMVWQKEFFSWLEETL